jgi:hypothetical protein
MMLYSPLMSHLISPPVRFRRIHTGISMSGGPRNWMDNTECHPYMTSSSASRRAATDPSRVEGWLHGLHGDLAPCQASHSVGTRVGRGSVPGFDHFRGSYSKARGTRGLR